MISNISILEKKGRKNRESQINSQMVIKNINYIQHTCEKNSEMDGFVLNDINLNFISSNKY